MKFLSAPFWLLWQQRALLYQTTRHDIQARYAGSVLGLAWLALYPVLFLGAYAVVYLYIFKVRLALFEPNEYVVLMFCGLIPFLGFAEALATGVSSVTGNANLIKNTLFTIEMVPVKAVLTSQCTQVIGMGMLLVAVLWLGRLTIWACLLPVIWLWQILFTIGCIWVLASLNVYIRDLQSMVSILNLILMMMSPIAYSADMIPEGLQAFLGLNPLYYLIIAYQDCLMLGRFPRGEVFLVLSVMSLVSFGAGYWFFGCMKKAFADNV
jgi:lipopolysaccharide transport system permease protein